MAITSKTTFRGFRFLTTLLVFILLLGTGVVPQVTVTQATAQSTAEDRFKPEFDPEEFQRALGEDHVTNHWIYHDSMQPAPKRK